MVPKTKIRSSSITRGVLLFLTKIIKLTCIVDAYEMREVILMGFLNAYLHTEIPKKDKDEQVVMKIRVKLVRWLVKLETLARKHGDGKR